MRRIIRRPQTGRIDFATFVDLPGFLRRKQGDRGSLYPPILQRSGAPGDALGRSSHKAFAPLAREPREPRRRHSLTDRLSSSSKWSTWRGSTMSKHRRLLGLGVTTLALLASPLAHAQKPSEAPPQQAASEGAQAAPESAPQQEAPATWSGLPFTSLADYERLIPIGMTRRDLVRALGQPETIMPGMGADRVYHYLYVSTEGTQLRAVIIVRDGAVFIRRLYQSTASGATARVN